MITDQSSKSQHQFFFVSLHCYNLSPAIMVGFSGTVWFDMIENLHLGFQDLDPTYLPLPLAGCGLRVQLWDKNLIDFLYFSFWNLDLTHPALPLAVQEHASAVRSKDGHQPRDVSRVCGQYTEFEETKLAQFFLYKMLNNLKYANSWKKKWKNYEYSIRLTKWKRFFLILILSREWLLALWQLKVFHITWSTLPWTREDQARCWISPNLWWSRRAEQ